MATVRIYKVAELLNTSSQEVMALLKRDHGIEVKSASSTIEEVVAREFVSRMMSSRACAGHSVHAGSVTRVRWIRSQRACCHSSSELRRDSHRC